MRDILAHAVVHAEPWGDSVRYACQLANWVRASLTIVAQPAPANTNVGEEERAGGVPVIAGAFGCFASSLGVRHSRWIVHEGNLTAALAHLAQWHDLVVLDAEDIARADHLLGRLQLVAHAPCLIVPTGWTSSLRPACIAVEWDASLSAVLAVRAALPLLERAGRVVFLLAPARQTRYVEPGLPTFELEDFCTRHELKTEYRIVEAPQRAEAWMEAAIERHAELLVVAAQGRTGFSQRLLHPVTEGLLRQSPIPLFLRH
jgi:nucleotide-binding universal stress UspA family protein